METDSGVPVCATNPQILSIHQLELFSSLPSPFLYLSCFLFIRVQFPINVCPLISDHFITRFIILLLCHILTRKLLKRQKKKQHHFMGHNIMGLGTVRILSELLILILFDSASLMGEHGKNGRHCNIIVEYI